MIKDARRNGPEIHNSGYFGGRYKANGGLGHVLLLEWGSGYRNVSFVIIH